MGNEHLDKLAQAQQHDDFSRQAKLMQDLLTAMDALNSKEFNYLLPDNLRIKQTEGEPFEIIGEVKAIISNAIEIGNLDELADHFKAIHTALEANASAMSELGKNQPTTMQVDGIGKMVELLEKLANKEVAVTKVNNQVVVFPKKPADAIPVRLVMSKQDKFYDAIFSSHFSAPDNVRINNTSEQPIPVTLVSGNAGDYNINDIEDGTTSYFGYTKSDSTWLIKKVTDTGVSYANIGNNATNETYTEAWGNRATLTYQRYDEAF